jgi:hypothetical protein
MKTLAAMFDAASPAAVWILENVPARTPGPLEALIALEIAKKSVLVAAAHLPGFSSEWERIQSELDEKVECFVVELARDNRDSN